jgi:hypothetical protein
MTIIFPITTPYQRIDYVTGAHFLLNRTEILVALPPFDVACSHNFGQWRRRKCDTRRPLISSSEVMIIRA